MISNIRSALARKRKKAMIEAIRAHIGLTLHMIAEILKDLARKEERWFRVTNETLIEYSPDGVTWLSDREYEEDDVISRAGFDSVTEHEIIVDSKAEVVKIWYRVNREPNSDYTFYANAMNLCDIAPSELDLEQRDEDRD